MLHKLNTLRTLSKMKLPSENKWELLLRDRSVFSEETTKKWLPHYSDNLTLLEEFKSLPGFMQTNISFIIRLLENPASPFCLGGAIPLYEHDCVHLLLGRGLTMQDEAFVIGFTMGNDPTFTQYQNFIYKYANKFFFEKQYKFTKREYDVFNLAVNYGRSLSVKNIHLFDFYSHLNWEMGKLRDLLGIKKEDLSVLFKKEQEIMPETETSKRLPI